ncbi:MAG: hypothetical protein MJ033_02585 [Victivallaceae bacterium]|nr:hypothetical protein [Victivallaceae bacterium]
MMTPELLIGKTLEIARCKMVTVSAAPETVLAPRLGTGGGFTDIFLWDTAFSVQWAKYYPQEFCVENSLDNFYRFQSEDGFIGRQYLPDGRNLWGKRYGTAFAPPLLGWAELELDKMGLFPGRLKKVYPHLLRQFEWNFANYRRADGLFFTDMWGSGMDDIPRWDDPADRATPGGMAIGRDIIALDGAEGDKKFASLLKWNEMFHFDWNRQLGWCDTSCQMAFFAWVLAEIATRCGDLAAAEKMRAFHREIADHVNHLCFDEKKHFYFDRLGDRLLSRRHVGAFWALISHVADEEKAAALISELKNPDRFGLPCGVPGVAADDPDFDLEHGYWRGPVWAPTMYMVLRGLREYNEESLARDLAKRFYNAVSSLYESTGTIWENYLPDRSDVPSGNANRDFCGWSALVPISIYREFIG